MPNDFKKRNEIAKQLLKNQGMNNPSSEDIALLAKTLTHYNITEAGQIQKNPIETIRKVFGLTGSEAVTVLDYETRISQGKQIPYPLQVAFKRITTNNIEAFSRFIEQPADNYRPEDDFFMKNGEKVSISKHTGLTSLKMARGQKIKAGEELKRMGAGKDIILAYNAQFDAAILDLYSTGQWKNKKVIDVQTFILDVFGKELMDKKIIKPISKGSHFLKGYKLEDIATYFGVLKQGQSQKHEALSDVELTIKVFSEAVGRLQKMGIEVDRRYMEKYVNKMGKQQGFDYYKNLPVGHKSKEIDGFQYINLTNGKGWILVGAIGGEKAMAYAKTKYDAKKIAESSKEFQKIAKKAETYKPQALKTSQRQEITRSDFEKLKKERASKEKPLLETFEELKDLPFHKQRLIEELEKVKNYKKGNYIKVGGKDVNLDNFVNKKRVNLDNVRQFKLRAGVSKKEQEETRRKEQIQINKTIFTENASSYIAKRKKMSPEEFEKLKIIDKNGKMVSITNLPVYKKYEEIYEKSKGYYSRRETIISEDIKTIEKKMQKLFEVNNEIKKIEKEYSLEKHSIVEDRFIDAKFSTNKDYEVYKKTRAVQKARMEGRLAEYVKEAKLLGSKDRITYDSNLHLYKAGNKIAVSVTQHGDDFFDDLVIQKTIKASLNTGNAFNRDFTQKVLTDIEVQRWNFYQNPENKGKSFYPDFEKYGTSREVSLVQDQYANMNKLASKGTAMHGIREDLELGVLKQGLDSKLTEYKQKNPKATIRDYLKKTMDPKEYSKFGEILIDKYTMASKKGLSFERDMSSIYGKVSSAVLEDWAATLKPFLNKTQKGKPDAIQNNLALEWLNGIILSQVTAMEKLGLSSKQWGIPELKAMARTGKTGAFNYIGFQKDLLVHAFKYIYDGAVKTMDIDYKSAFKVLPSHMQQIILNSLLTENAFNLSSSKAIVLSVPQTGKNFKIFDVDKGTQVSFDSYNEKMQFELATQSLKYFQGKINRQTKLPELINFFRGIKFDQHQGWRRNQKTGKIEPLGEGVGAHIEDASGLTASVYLKSIMGMIGNLTYDQREAIVKTLTVPFKLEDDKTSTMKQKLGMQDKEVVGKLYMLLQPESFYGSTSTKNSLKVRKAALEVLNGIYGLGLSSADPTAFGKATTALRTKILGEEGFDDPEFEPSGDTRFADSEKEQYAIELQKNQNRQNVIKIIKTDLAKFGIILHTGKNGKIDFSYDKNLINKNTTEAVAAFDMKALVEQYTVDYLGQEATSPKTKLAVKSEFPEKSFDFFNDLSRFLTKSNNRSFRNAGFSLRKRLSGLSDGPDALANQFSQVLTTAATYKTMFLNGKKLTQGQIEEGAEAFAIAQIYEDNKNLSMTDIIGKIQSSSIISSQNETAFKKFIGMDISEELEQKPSKKTGVKNLEIYSYHPAVGLDQIGVRINYKNGSFKKIDLDNLLYDISPELEKLLVVKMKEFSGRSTENEKLLHKAIDAVAIERERGNLEGYKTLSRKIDQSLMQDLEAFQIDDETSNILSIEDQGGISKKYRLIENILKTFSSEEGLMSFEKNFKKQMEEEQHDVFMAQFGLTAEEQQHVLTANNGRPMHHKAFYDYLRFIKGFPVSNIATQSSKFKQIINFMRKYPEFAPASLGFEVSQKKDIYNYDTNDFIAIENFLRENKASMGEKRYEELVKALPSLERLIGGKGFEEKSSKISGLKTFSKKLNVKKNIKFKLKNKYQHLKNTEKSIGLNLEELMGRRQYFQDFLDLEMDVYYHRMQFNDGKFGETDPQYQDLISKEASLQKARKGWSEVLARDYKGLDLAIEERRFQLGEFTNTDPRYEALMLAKQDVSISPEKYAMFIKNYADFFIERGHAGMTRENYASFLDFRSIANREKLISIQKIIKDVEKGEKAEYNSKIDASLKLLTEALEDRGIHLVGSLGMGKTEKEGGTLMPSVYDKHFEDYTKDIKAVLESFIDAFRGAAPEFKQQMASDLQTRGKLIGKSGLTMSPKEVLEQMYSKINPDPDFAYDEENFRHHATGAFGETAVESTIKSRKDKVQTGLKAYKAKYSSYKKLVEKGGPESAHIEAEQLWDMENDLVGSGIKPEMIEQVRLEVNNLEIILSQKKKVQEIKQKIQELNRSALGSKSVQDKDAYEKLASSLGKSEGFDKGEMASLQKLAQESFLTDLLPQQRLGVLASRYESAMSSGTDKQKQATSKELLSFDKEKGLPEELKGKGLSTQREVDLKIRMQEYMQAVVDLNNVTQAAIDDSTGKMKEAVTKIEGIKNAAQGKLNETIGELIQTDPVKAAEAGKQIKQFDQKYAPNEKEAKEQIREFLAQTKERSNVKVMAKELEHKLQGATRVEQKAIRSKIQKISEINKNLNPVYNPLDKTISYTEMGTGKDVVRQLGDDENTNVRKSLMGIERGEGTKIASIEGRTPKANTLVKKIMSGFQQSLARAVDYGLAYAFIAKFKQMVQTIVQTTQQLEKIGVNIQIVTGKSSEDVGKMIKGYSKLGQSLGRTTAEVASSANEFLRMGYTGRDATEMISQAMTLSTLGMIEASEAAKFLTAAVKGYKVEVNDVSKVVDMATALDMKFATSAGQILQAMSRTAASAKLARVEMANLQSMLTVVIETSQKSAESVGEAFKTAFARYGNVKAGRVTFGDLNDETDGVNDIERALSKLNIKIRDSSSQWRSYQDVLDEIGAKWKNWTDLEKNLVTTAMFGIRQREVGNVLLDNFDTYKRATNIAVESEGTSSEKMFAYTQSLEASTKRVTVAWEEITQKFDLKSLLMTFNDTMALFIRNLDAVLFTAGALVLAIKGSAVARIATNAMFSMGASAYGYKDGLGGSVLNAFGKFKQVIPSKETLDIAQRKQATRYLEKAETTTHLSEIDKLMHKFSYLGETVSTLATTMNNATGTLGGKPVTTTGAGFDMRTAQIDLMSNTSGKQQDLMIKYLSSSDPSVKSGLLEQLNGQGANADLMARLKHVETDPEAQKNLLTAMELQQKDTQFGHIGKFGKGQPSRKYMGAVRGLAGGVSSATTAVYASQIGSKAASNAGGNAQVGQMVGGMMGASLPMLANAIIPGIGGIVASVVIPILAGVISSVIVDWDAAVGKMADVIGSIKEKFITFEDYAGSIKNIKETMDSGLLTQSEYQEQSSQLLNIQRRMVEEYGDIAYSLDLINSSYGTIHDQIVDMMQKEALSWKNENKKIIKDYDKALEKGKTNTNDIYSQNQSALRYYGQFKMIETKPEAYKELLVVKDRLDRAQASGNQGLIDSAIKEVVNFRESISETFDNQYFVSEIEKYVTNVTATADAHINRETLKKRIINWAAFKEAAEAMDGMSTSASSLEIANAGLTEQMDVLKMAASQAGVSVEDLMRVLVDLGHMSPDLSNKTSTNVFARIKALEAVEKPKEWQTEELDKLNKTFGRFLSLVGVTREQFEKFEVVLGRISIEGTITDTLSQVATFLSSFSNIEKDLKNGLINIQTFDDFVNKFPEFVGVFLGGFAEFKDFLKGFTGEAGVVGLEEALYKTSIRKTLLGSEQYTEIVAKQAGLNELLDPTKSSAIATIPGLSSYKAKKNISDDETLTVRKILTQNDIEYGRADYETKLNDFYQAYASKDYINQYTDSLEAMENWTIHFTNALNNYSANVIKIDGIVSGHVDKVYDKTAILLKANRDLDQYKKAYQFIENTINKQIEALQKVNDERKKTIELMKLEENLAKARANKVKVYKEGYGFVYEEDADAVKEAQRSLTEYLDEQSFQNQIKKLEDVKKSWTDIISEAEIQASKQALIDLKGIDFTDSLLSKGLTSMQAQVVELAKEAALAIAIINGTGGTENTENLTDDETGKGGTTVIPRRQEPVDTVGPRGQPSTSGLHEAKSSADFGFLGVGATVPKAVSGDLSNLDSKNSVGTVALPAGISVRNNRTGEMEDISSVSGYMKENTVYLIPDVGYVVKVGDTVRQVSSFKENNHFWKDNFVTADDIKWKAYYESTKASIPAFASGTENNKYTQMALVGENGPELSVLPKGAGIIPNPITRNLWKMGSNPEGYVSRYADSPKTTGSPMSNNEENSYILNGVVVKADNADEFIETIKATFKDTATKRTHQRK